MHSVRILPFIAFRTFLHRIMQSEMRTTQSSGTATREENG